MKRILISAVLALAACGAEEDQQQPEESDRCFEYPRNPSAPGLSIQEFCVPGDWQEPYFCWETGADECANDSERERACYVWRAFAGGHLEPYYGEPGEMWEACGLPRACEPNFVDNQPCCEATVTEAHDCAAD